MRGANAEARVKALLVTRRQDVGYLTGFSGEDSWLALGRGWACLITDGRYAEQAGRECAGVEIHCRPEAMPSAVGRVLKGRGVRRLGVQGDHITLEMKDRLAAVIGGRKIRALCGVLERLRAVKDAGELRAIRKAIRIGERAMRELIAGRARKLIGRTERDVAAELDYRMRRLGADGPAFETIVAAGAHASRPHYRPGRARIRRGQAVLIDWGATVESYCGDLTRVLFTGRIPPKLTHIYEVVLRAQAAGIAAIAPGVACKSVCVAARAVVEAAGYGKCWLHGLGHGIGRAVHEAPALSCEAPGRLRKGMVVTVEPGIYVTGLGGVRIEDDVVVTSRGGLRLSSLPRTLAAMRLR